MLGLDPVHMIWKAMMLLAYKFQLQLQAWKILEMYQKSHLAKYM